MNSGAIFEPEMDNVYLFSKSQLMISCKFGERVILEGKFKGTAISPRPIVSDISLLPYESQYVDRHLKVGDAGQIHCKSLSDGRILKTWTITTLGKHTVYISAFSYIIYDKYKCKMNSIVHYKLIMRGKLRILTLSDELIVHDSRKKFKDTYFYHRHSKQSHPRNENASRQIASNLSVLHYTCGPNEVGCGFLSRRNRMRA